MKSKITFVAATFSLALTGCGEEPEPVDTSFEETLPAPVPVEDGPGVPDNEIGTPLDDVEVDYDDGSADEDAAETGSPSESMDAR